MRIAVVGMGNVGSLVGAALAAGGQEVFWVDHRPERADRLNGSFLTLTVAPSVETAVRGTAVRRWVRCPPRLPFPGPAVWLMCVKSYQTAETLATLGPLLPPGAMVVLMQNGVPDTEACAAALPSQILALGSISWGARKASDHEVVLTGAGETFLGLAGGTNAPALEELAAALSAVGLPAHVTPRILDHVWQKWLVNVGINAPAALFRVPNGLLLAPPLWSYLELVVSEAERVLRAMGRSPMAPPLEAVRTVAERTKSNRNSMLQDLDAARPTEILALNSLVSREGRRLGVPTPVNEALVALISACESRAKKPAPGAETTPRSAATLLPIGPVAPSPASVSPG